MALCSPNEELKKLQDNNQLTKLMAKQEEMKIYPFGDVWEEYLSREDCIAAYADEFGKTVVDYAIEFKNYDFIKYLVDHDYITLVVDDPRWNAFPNFGAEKYIFKVQARA